MHQIFKNISNIMLFFSNVIFFQSSTEYAKSFFFFFFFYQTKSLPQVLAGYIMKHDEQNRIKVWNDPQFFGPNYRSFPLLNCFFYNGHLVRTDDKQIVEISIRMKRYHRVLKHVALNQILTQQNLIKKNMASPFLVRENLQIDEGPTLKGCKTKGSQ